MNNQSHDASYKWLALLVVILGTFMAILDSSIVNIAVPKMMAVFGVSVEESRWIITAYSLALGGVVPITGYLSDKFGTKKLYILSLIVFTIGSLLCGISWTNNIMIVSRVIQGLGGGAIMPVSMSIIYQLVPKEERGMALGLWGISAMAAPAIGPTLSGYIIEYLDWRLIFTLNIPIGIITVILAWLLLKESPTKPLKSFDLLGFLTSVIGLISCLYVLGEGSSVDWGDIKNILLLTIGIFSLIIFVINELYHPSPLLDLRILKIFPFSLSILISSVLNMAMFGVIFIMPLFLQNLRGLTPMQTGILMFPSAIASGLAMPLSGKFYDKYGAKPIVIPGLLILAYTTYELSKITLDTTNEYIKIILVIRGFAMGMAMMPCTSAGMHFVPPHLIAGASALSNTIRQIAAAISVTLLTTILQNKMDLSYMTMAGDINPFNQSSTALLQMFQGFFLQSGYNSGDTLGLSLNVISGIIAKQAYMDAIGITLIVSTFFAIIAIALAFFINDDKHAKIGDSKTLDGEKEAEHVPIHE